MATRKVKQEVIKAESFDKLDRFKVGEMGNIGLRMFNGVSVDELKTELNFPNNIKVFKEMSYHSAVNAPLTLFENIISKAEWVFNPPENATEEEKEQCKIVNTMMRDMDTSWDEFIREVLSMNLFGFSVHEVVGRTRKKSLGSKYDDGYIGWKKLPIRSQETIEKFLFSDDGNEIVGVRQNTSLVKDVYGRFSPGSKLMRNIPKKKLLLFKIGRHRGDPFGKSPLRDAYLSWRFLTALEELEATGVAKDLVGFPVLYIPPELLSESATPQQKALRAYFENGMRNLQAGSQSCMIIPQIIDPETRLPSFKLDLLSVDGKKGYDIVKIKEYYKNLIFTSMFADILQMGQGSTGSFALGSIKNSLSGAYAERIAKSICEVLNEQLARLTYELNGWDTSRMGSFDFDNLQDSDLDSFSSAVQRMGAVGYLPQTPEVFNKVLDSIGVDSMPEDTDFFSLLPEKTSRSGDGMQSGLGSGTGDAVTSNDSSVSNVSNAP